jgi:hypothetical protein
MRIIYAMNIHFKVVELQIQTLECSRKVGIGRDPSHPSHPEAGRSAKSATPEILRSNKSLATLYYIILFFLMKA